MAGPMNTFGRQSHVSEIAPDTHLHGAANAAPAHSSLKKGGSAAGTRTSSQDRMVADEARSVEKQLESEVQLYEAIAKGASTAEERTEVSEWAERALAMVSRAILSVSPSKAPGLDTRTREQSLDSLCYLKERITAVEGILVQSRDRADAVSPRLAASNLDTARYAQSARTPAATKSQRNDDGLFSNGKDSNAREAYKTYDQRDHSAGGGATQFQSQYGRELSEKYEAARRRDPPQSARDPQRSTDSQPLRNFSRSGSRGRLDGENGSPDQAHCVQSPAF